MNFMKRQESRPETIGCRRNALDSKNLISLFK